MRNYNWKKDRKIDIDEHAMQIAMALYEEFGLDVELIRDISSEGLKRLINSGNKFQLIYIDGSHEGFNPLIDFALCTRLIEPGGVIMLDDHHWPDVKTVKELCDRHLPKVYESWKVVAYKWEV
jgi:predicted O-methyltransferase YrrM